MATTALPGAPDAETRAPAPATATPSSGAAGAAGAASSVHIRLTASTPPSLRGAHGLELSIPASAGRNALRTLVHHLVPQAAAAAADLHFLAAGEPLRSSLGAFLARRAASLSREATLDVVYYLPLPAPRLRASTKASADWLSSLAVLPPAHHQKAPQNNQQQQQHQKQRSQSRRREQEADSESESESESDSDSGPESDNDHDERPAQRKRRQRANQHNVKQQYQQSNSAAPTVLVGSFSGAPAVLRGADTVVSEDRLLQGAAGVHAAPIKAVEWLPSGRHFLTAAQDRVARVWAYDPADGAATPVAQFRADDAGCAAGLCAAAATGGKGPDGEGEKEGGAATVALGAEDGSLWLLPAINTRALQPSPRPGAGRRCAGKLASLPAVRIGAGTLPLPVSALCWWDPHATTTTTTTPATGTNATLLSGGWDAVVREWDVEHCAARCTIPCGGKPVTDLAAGRRAHAIAAVDGGVRLVDGRDGRGVVGACGRRGAHIGVVTAVQWLHSSVDATDATDAAQQEHAIVSAGFDGSVRLWDVRAMLTPARVVERVNDGAKIMALCAVRHGDADDGGDGQFEVFSAGANGRVARLVI